VSDGIQRYPGALDTRPEALHGFRKNSINIGAVSRMGKSKKTGSARDHNCCCKPIHKSIWFLLQFGSCTEFRAKLPHDSSSVPVEKKRFLPSPRIGTELAITGGAIITARIRDQEMRRMITQSS
jgi:hypothetical protein